MKNKLYTYVLTIITVFVLIFTPCAAFSDTDPEFVLKADKTELIQGDVFIVSVFGQNLKDLYGYEIYYKYDPQILKLQSIKSETSENGFSVGPKKEGDKEYFAYTKTGEEKGDSGSIGICTLTFQVIGKGNSNISIESIKLVGSNYTVKNCIISKSVKVDAKEESKNPTTPSTITAAKTFKDIRAYPWAKNAIEFLAANGIVSGTSQNTFQPNKNIIRADFIIMLVKALGLDAGFDANFDDVNQKDYFYKAVGIAKKLGITAGVGNNRFNPRSYITREDMMTLIFKALKIAGKKLETGTDSDLGKFTDKPSIAAYAVESVATFVKNGIIVGYGNKISPHANATRAETAVIIYKVYKTYMEK